MKYYKPDNSVIVCGLCINTGCDYMPLDFFPKVFMAFICLCVCVYKIHYFHEQKGSKEKEMYILVEAKAIETKPKAPEDKVNGGDSTYEDHEMNESLDIVNNETVYQVPNDAAAEKGSLELSEEVADKAKESY